MPERKLRRIHHDYIAIMPKKPQDLEVLERYLQDA
jgi:hypothetical protein